MTPPPALLALALALALDAAIGDPAWLYDRLPHPVVLIGRLIGWLDGALNREGAGDGWRRAAGVAAVLALLAAAVLPAWVLAHWLAHYRWGWLVEAVPVAMLLAQRSLYDHVAAVAAALRQDGLPGGRAAVSQIVGRAPESLDEAGVARAAIESCAENFSDGIAAPLFWYAVAGLPGIVAYKAVNTADSMIGHRTPRHRAFGWAAARLDDLLNLVPARLSGLAIALAGALLPGSGRVARLGNGLKAMVRDAPRHRSPNAGWPEAAMAGVLGLALAGPRRYGTVLVDDAWMGAGRRVADADDIARALAVMVRAVMLVAVAALAAAKLTG